MIPDEPYGMKPPHIASPLSQASLAFSSTHDFLDRLNALISSAVGEDTPATTAIATGSASTRSLPMCDGALGDISRSAVSMQERVNYMQGRLDALHRALAYN